MSSQVLIWLRLTGTCLYSLEGVLVISLDSALLQEQFSVLYNLSKLVHILYGLERCEQ